MSFGWSLPAGVSTLPGEEAIYCPSCGLSDAMWDMSDFDEETCTDAEGRVFCSPLCLQQGALQRDEYGRLIVEGDRQLDPYGHLTWTIGTGDDFICLDLGRHGALVALFAVVNSETGSFIDSFRYWEGSYKEAIDAAAEILDQAADWCYTNELKRPSIRKPQRRFMCEVNKLVLQIRKEESTRHGTDRRPA